MTRTMPTTKDKTPGPAGRARKSGALESTVTPVGVVGFVGVMPAENAVSMPSRRRYGCPNNNNYSIKMKERKLAGKRQYRYPLLQAFQNQEEHGSGRSFRAVVSGRCSEEHLPEAVKTTDSLLNTHNPGTVPGCQAQNRPGALPGQLQKGAEMTMVQFANRLLRDQAAINAAISREHAKEAIADAIVSWATRYDTLYLLDVMVARSMASSVTWVALDSHNKSLINDISNVIRKFAEETMSGRIDLTDSQYASVLADRILDEVVYA